MQNSFVTGAILNLWLSPIISVEQKHKSFTIISAELRNSHTGYLTGTLQGVLSSLYNRIVTATQEEHLMPILQLKINYRFALKPLQRLLIFIGIIWLEIFLRKQWEISYLHVWPNRHYLPGMRLETSLNSQSALTPLVTSISKIIWNLSLEKFVHVLLNTKPWQLPEVSSNLSKEESDFQDVCSNLQIKLHRNISRDLPSKWKVQQVWNSTQ